MKITKKLDITGYLNDEIIKNKKTCYKLFAIVNCEGKTLQTSKYHSIVNRYDKANKKSNWIKFNGA